jgi:hypothetical protein
MSKISALQNALKTTSGKPDTALRSIPAPSAPASTERPPSRVGQVNISAWLNRDFKKSLRLVQARKLENASLQDLVAEALNDLFSKYDVPTVHQD